MSLVLKPSDFKRDAKKVFATLKEKENKIFATVETKLYIPARFEERSMAFVGNEVFVIGIFALCAGQTYGVSTVNAVMQITPSSFRKVVFEDVDYIEFTFDPGSVIFPNLDLVKKDTVVYQIFDELISKGNIPWYLDYLDLGCLFDTAKTHANAPIGTERELIEILVSLISRDSKDPNKYYRQTVKSLDEVKTKPPRFIAMKSVVYAATDALNKIAGSYMGDGVISALVNPTQKTSHVEELLRK